MRTPGFHIADDIKKYDAQIQVGNIWVLARPLPWISWKMRWKCAWDVFTGKADALYWKGQ